MMFGYREAFAYFQCIECGCLQIREFPDDMARYYPEHYYSYQEKSTRNGASRFMATLRDRYALTGKGMIGKLLYSRFPREELRSLQRLSPSKEMRILDVGCGAGVLLATLHGQGMTELLGIDPFNPGDIEYTGGLQILKKEIHEVDGEWDLVMFHHSLEHIPDQTAVLQGAARLLTSGGFCLVRVPLVSSHVWSHFGTNWVQLDAPRHFYLHSVGSMSMLAGQAGLRVEHIAYDSTAFQFWGSEQYVRDIPLQDARSYLQNPGASEFSRKDIAAFSKRAKELNAAGLGDQAVFYLRRD